MTPPTPNPAPNSASNPALGSPTSGPEKPGKEEPGKAGGKRSRKAPRKGKGAPKSETSERRCIVSGAVHPKSRLIRFVVGPEGDLVPDLAEKLPGRGLWVEASREALDEAIDKKLFSKAARTRVDVSQNLATQVNDLLVERAIAHLGLAKRAGVAITGFEKVEALFAKKAPAALLEAADGAADGRNKLIRLLKKHERSSRKAIKVVGLLNSSELSLAFGHQHVIHAALTAAPVAKMALDDLERLAGFRPMVPAAWYENLQLREIMEPEVEDNS